MDFNDSFFSLKEKQFVLFGVCGATQYCYEYLSSLGMSENISFLIDNDEKKQGKEFLNKKIYSFDALKDFPNAVVIITTMFFGQVYEQIKAANLPNPIYVSLMAATLKNETIDCASYSKNFCYDLTDPVTSASIDMVIAYCNDNKFCKIQPYENVELLKDRSYDYWPCFDKKITLLSKKSLTICDVGAFNGDSIKSFIDRYGARIKKIYAFEPNEINISELKTNANDLIKQGVVEVFPVGLGSKEGTYSFKEDADESTLCTDGNSNVSIKCLDNISINVYGKLCIKMDIEGFELEALKGAANLIKEHKPDLAICIYHKSDDLFEIPQYIRTLVPEYKCIIRGGLHMVCYASVDY